jgi:dUTP pyrophosphatase
MSVVLKVQRIDKSVPLPSYGHVGDAACDLFAREETVLRPNERVQVPTGLKMEIPHGFGVFIWDKSGLSHKHGLKTLGGVIDAGFRGEVMVGVINLSSEPYTIEKGHKVAQMVVQRLEEVTILETDTFSGSTRGEGGFGSTGK